MAGQWTYSVNKKYYCHITEISIRGRMKFFGFKYHHYLEASEPK